MAQQLECPLVSSLRRAQAPRGWPGSRARLTFLRELHQGQNETSEPLHSIRSTPRRAGTALRCRQPRPARDPCAVEPEQPPTTHGGRPRRLPEAMRLAIRSARATSCRAPECRGVRGRPGAPAPRAAPLGNTPAAADVMVVLGAAGGVGTSFVACNLAQASPRRRARRRCSWTWTSTRRRSRVPRPEARARVAGRIGGSRVP